MLLPELKKLALKDEKKGRLHQRLTIEKGHPKLREHLVSTVTIMKLSRNYQDFIIKINLIHPRYNETMSLDLDMNDQGEV